GPAGWRRYFFMRRPLYHGDVSPQDTLLGGRGGRLGGGGRGGGGRLLGLLLLDQAVELLDALVERLGLLAERVDVGVVLRLLDRLLEVAEDLADDLVLPAEVLVAVFEGTRGDEDE